ncbi:MAG: hypothetical protein KC462_01065 [Cyanobacteria bacterium HKST-UBA05]|nr:hypothetical protein [Cyanobacteria bacterium HKST-UBA05]
MPVSALSSLPPHRLTGAGLPLARLQPSASAPRFGNGDAAHNADESPYRPPEPAPKKKFGGLGWSGLVVLGLMALAFSRSTVPRHEDGWHLGKAKLEWIDKAQAGSPELMRVTMADAKETNVHVIDIPIDANRQPHFPQWAGFRKTGPNRFHYVAADGRQFDVVDDPSPPQSPNPFDGQPRITRRLQVTSHSKVSDDTRRLWVLYSEHGDQWLVADRNINGTLDEADVSGF